MNLVTRVTVHGPFDAWDAYRKLRESVGTPLCIDPVVYENESHTFIGTPFDQGLAAKVGVSHNLRRVEIEDGSDPWVPLQWEWDEPSGIIFLETHISFNIEGVLCFHVHKHILDALLPQLARPGTTFSARMYPSACDPELQAYDFENWTEEDEALAQAEEFRSSSKLLDESALPTSKQSNSTAEKDTRQVDTGQPSAGLRMNVELPLEDQAIIWAVIDAMTQNAPHPLAEEVIAWCSLTAGLE